MNIILHVTPQLITPIQIGETIESQLVQIDNVIFTNGGSTFTANTAFDFISNGQSGRMYVKNSNSLVGTLIPMGPVTLIGLSSQHTYNFGCPHTGTCPASDGYQIIPRDTSDIICRALEATHKMHADLTLLTATAFEKALKTLY